MYTDINRELRLKDNAPYTSIVDGTNYPRNWNKDNIPELFKVTETPRPDDTETHVTLGYIIDETYTQVWQTRLKTAEELQYAIDAHNAQIDAELFDADMAIVRALVEGDTARIEEHKISQATKRLLKK